MGEKNLDSGPSYADSVLERRGSGLAAIIGT
jgi:hypothetical protein